ncbi:SFT2 domain-containing protein [Cryptococcus gattii Ru294]|nr:SFT2 domain-containing protein [Cryptococcus gattii Ru294]
MSGYIPLRNEGNSQEEEAYFALSVSGLGTSCVAFLDANALIQSSEVGKVPWISCLLCWWNSMFWYRILISAHSYVVTAPRGYFGCQNVFVNICTGLYPWKLLVHAWICHLTWSLEPSHPLFRHRYQIHNRHTPGLNHTSRCLTIIRDSLLPRRHDYFEARGPNGHERRREPITNLIMRPKVINSEMYSNAIDSCPVPA